METMSTTRPGPSKSIAFGRRVAGRLWRAGLAPVRWVQLAGLAVAARRTALALNGLAMEFDATGRRFGWRDVRRGRRRGWELLLHPVESVRYVEFAFVRDCLPATPGECLDVSSPRLFSLHVASGCPARITMLNPDPADVKETAELVRDNGLANITLQVGAVEFLAAAGMEGRFDAIWSISVVEHIEGGYSDGEAVQMMYRALAPGGRLMLTVPVDRRFRIESSAHQLYGTQPRLPDGTYFFQRFYDAQAIQTRLSDALGRAPAVVRWFGEKRAGWWKEYRAACDRRGLPWHVADPAEMAKNFGEYDSWDAMPGMGICGLMYEKPGSAPAPTP
jgi:SAM-dependent methyltransferase